MVKVVVIGSCKHSPYQILLVPDPLRAEYTPETHEEFNTEDLYREACGIFYPAMREADEVWVYAPDGKVGEHTKRDLEYARSQGKRIKYITGNPPAERDSGSTELTARVPRNGLPTSSGIPPPPRLGDTIYAAEFYYGGGIRKKYIAGRDDVLAISCEGNCYVVQYPYGYVHVRHFQYVVVTTEKDKDEPHKDS